MAGNFLSRPKRDGPGECDTNEKVGLSYGVIGVQGWRLSMEVCLSSLQNMQRFKRFLHVSNRVSNMIKTFILLNCFCFSYRYFQVSKIASNLRQFGRRKLSMRFWFLIQFWHVFSAPWAWSTTKHKIDSQLRSRRACFLFSLTVVNSVLR